MQVKDELSERIDALKGSREFRAYERVRDEVFRLRELDRDRRGGVNAPSEYWEEELAGFEYLFDPSPLVVEKLRHHSYHVTGLKVHDYRSHKGETKQRFAAKLDALIDAAGGRELLVPEPRILGGFGHEIGGELFNIDTLKFFEVLIAMERGALLEEFRDGERRAVWEIGPGWGGFAHAFKTLFPSVTYIMTDLPQLFLFSATYLSAAFPEAKLHFYDPDAEEPLGPPDADFVFVPNTFLNETRPSSLALAINMVSFQEMTAEQVHGYVHHAYELGAPYLYSLNRDRSPYNPQMTNVRDIIAKWYWPQQVEVLPGVQYTQLPPAKPGSKAVSLAAQAGKKAKKSAAKKSANKPDLGYKHVVGWRRTFP